MQRPPSSSSDYSMLDDETTSRWIGRNTLGLPVQEYADPTDWDAPFDDITAVPVDEDPAADYAAAQYQAALLAQAQYQAAAEAQYQAAHAQYHATAQAQYEAAQAQYYASTQPAPRIQPEQPTLRRWPAPAAPPPSAATTQTLRGYRPATVTSPVEIAVQAAELRSSHEIPFWFRTLVPGVALFGAMLFAGVILFVNPPASLTVRTMPADAELSIDGRRIDGSGSPYFVGDLTPGEHVLVVRKSGFEEHARTFQIASGEELSLPLIELAAIPPEPKAEPKATGAVAPSAKPARAASPARSARRTEFAPPAAPASERAPAAPKPSVADLGMLRINSRPWSKVYIDGKLIGHTPQLGVPLPAGQHRVELVNDELDMRKTIHVTIARDEIETQVVNLVE